jgi:sortase (surface protein transpeptidase)
VPLFASLILLGVFATAVGLGRVLGIPLPPLSFAGVLGDSSAMKPSTPTRISIPSIGVRADVVEVGNTESGSIAAPVKNPAGTAGWYGLGPTPGEPGTAIIVGHVDMADRPAVFERLREIKAGKPIEVVRKDRRVATFTVESVEAFPKIAFPTDRVFADTGTPRLAVITCGGPWIGGDLGYADNVIVFARLA